jgi:hypothetical protein
LHLRIKISPILRNGSWIILRSCLNRVGSIALDDDNEWPVDNDLELRGSGISVDNVQAIISRD